MTPPRAGATSACVGLSGSPSPACKSSSEPRAPWPEDWPSSWSPSRGTPTSPWTPTTPSRPWL
eukprot:6591802-Alexandrium_andersonii.AAC.1